jgi:hypothetical protein
MADVKTVEVGAAGFLDLLDELLGRPARFLGGEHDRRAVRIVGAHEMHGAALHALEAHPNVGLDVLHDVADVERPVRVGQCGGDEKRAGGHRLEAREEAKF